jgi:hypothetical protein
VLDEKSVQNFGWKPGGKRPLGRTRRGLEDNQDLREIGSESVDLVHLAEERDQWRALVNTAVNLLVP